jgi:hypothetical protein
MGEKAKRTWLDKLRDVRRARRDRAVERQRHREEHQRGLERAGKVGGSGDIGGGSIGG